MRERVKDVAKLLEIDDILKMKPKTLSGGQRQRVALGRALIRRPRLFLLDEPLSNLDAQLRERMRVDIRRLHDQVGVTTLYVTHDQTEAMTMADRIVVLNRGRIEQIGSPSEIYRSPASRFVASFIGAPSMNLVPVAVERQSPGWRLALQGGKGMAVTLPYGSGWDGTLERHREVWLGMRPERILLEPSDDAVRLQLHFQATEVLGARSTLHTRWGREPVTISVETEWGGEFGREVTAYVPAGALHFFDSASGRRLSQTWAGATQVMAD
jgi:sn-glycerol 3-phosphate transport system ATP-binding protein